jgi:hypothetical protein
MLAAVVGLGGTWQSEAPLPSKRTEVAGPPLRGEVVVGGGLRVSDANESIDACP